LNRCGKTPTNGSIEIIKYCLDNQEKIHYKFYHNQVYIYFAHLHHNYVIKLNLVINKSSIENTNNFEQQNANRVDKLEQQIKNLSDQLSMVQHAQHDHHHKFKDIDRKNGFHDCC
jgi:hypothetical protein